MLQAEVGGGGRVDPEEGLQKRGYVIRDFVLGARVQISDYCGRSNLALVFAGLAVTEFGFLREVARRCRDFTEQDAGSRSRLYPPQNAAPALSIIAGDGIYFTDRSLLLQCG